ncbi:MAG: potassium-transporting ATPase subunit F [Acidimicrobiia bacterium]|nr:potassium-transporting ATPase subunit F [Acidimicrobiia bacterium]
MNLENAVGLILALGLAAFLVFTLVYPERF